MAKIVSQTRYYAVLSGVEMSDDGDIMETEHVIDGRHVDADFLKRKARRLWPNFLPNEVVYHKQKAFVNAEEFYGIAEFGDDEVYEPHTKVVSEDKDNGIE